MNAELLRPLQSSPAVLMLRPSSPKTLSVAVLTSTEVSAETAEGFDGSDTPEVPEPGRFLSRWV